MYIVDKLVIFYMFNFFYFLKFVYFILVILMYDVLEIFCKVIKIYCLYICLKKLVFFF